MTIIIDIKSQKLFLYSKDNLILDEYIISTAKNGAGEKINSFQTPRGKHIVRAKIGANAPINTVFVARRPTGEIYSEKIAVKYPDRDWILTRILWLSGIEIGKNRLGDVDTFRRFIYIHGCPDKYNLGIPGSHGCIRIRNYDIIQLFDKISIGENVDIIEK